MSAPIKTMLGGLDSAASTSAQPESAGLHLLLVGVGLLFVLGVVASLNIAIPRCDAWVREAR